MIAWPAPVPITQNQVIILKLPTAGGELLEEVSRISDLGKEGESITAINYFGRIAYVGEFYDFVVCVCFSIPLTSFYSFSHLPPN